MRILLTRGDPRLVDLNFFFLLRQKKIKNKIKNSMWGFSVNNGLSIGRVITVTENSNSGMEEEEICRGKDGVGESSGGLEEEVTYIRTFS